jgi:hypothetical protein
VLGAAAAVAVEKLVTHQVPASWHLPTHGLVAGAATLTPYAGFGGAVFYSLISELYYGYLKNSILVATKAATDT